jgi:parvulin-like peptidyl-prolyl isomerase
MCYTKKESMKQKLLILFSCVSFFYSFGQTTSKQLSEIKTVEQANKLIKAYPKLEARLFTITSDKDTSDITLPLFDKKVGYSFTIDKFVYKIIESNSYPEFRASYIYLNGSQLSTQKIDSLRTEIITEFKKGISFFDLVKEFTMDGSLTGDLGWFSENMMMKEFEMAIRQHKKNDIFTVDIPENKWYYVTLKTFDDRIIKKLTILKIKSSA